MSSTAKAWAVATSNAAVEALKDQGFCGWNHTIRSLHQPAKNQVRSTSKTRKLSSPPSTVVSSKVRENHKAKQSEESMRKVMYLTYFCTMSWKSKVWTVVGSVAAVEDLKDKNMASSSSSKPAQVGREAAAAAPPPATTTSNFAPKREGKEKRVNQSEESLRTVMYLSCWGPN
ncbi:hypothetical protein POTOM_044710 [Populus tomentosa]|uniref:Wound-responsive family protein n=1 Tax=Populus tomentosa TaxID=118781 RepID=A0A8X7YMB5_POPTO|nr:hypothetical protein POTOM_044710 [Populus tomentosa]